MSLSWNYLTKPFIGMRYRELIGGIVISKWILCKWIDKNAIETDDSFVMVQQYTHDESDIAFREPNNMTDSAVRRQKKLEFSNRIKTERAKQEREMMLDAYNYLNHKNHAPTE